MNSFKFKFETKGLTLSELHRSEPTNFDSVMSLVPNIQSYISNQMC